MSMHCWQVGLQVLQRNEKVFACYESMWDTIYHSEVGASRAVLDAGFGLDSLMLRYKNVDWRNQSNWGCNGECVPTWLHSRAHWLASRHQAPAKHALSAGSACSLMRTGPKSAADCVRTSCHQSAQLLSRHCHAG